MVASTSISQVVNDHVEDDDFSRYLPLYKASVQGNWNEATSFLEQHSDAIKAPLNCNLETALHVAARAGDASFAEKLVAKLTDEAIGIKNRYGLTPLHLAAQFGNKEVAEILVGKNYNLLYHTTSDNNEGLLPIHYTACNTRKSKDVYDYFFGVTKKGDDGQANPYEGQSGATLLVNLIKSKFYDVAKNLVDKHPDLTCHKAFDSGESPLLALVKDDYPIIPLTRLGRPRRKTQMHQEALELLKCLCDKRKTLSDTQVRSVALDAILEAARLDIDEAVLKIVEAYPLAAYYQDNKSGQNILLIAIENRCEKVFNLIRENSPLMNILQDTRDNNGDNILHLVGKLAPPHKLNIVSGAALQMQRELQWFEEVKKIAKPFLSTMRDNKDKTPNMVFTEEHKDLKVEGEKWMKDTATSCTITTALIATITFAAAITVPGGNSDDNGLPYFYLLSDFKAFFAFNAASLYTSTISLILFLSILISHYAEGDFLYALPKRLIGGLVALYLSIIFMMLTFFMIIYLMFSHENGKWVLAGAVLASLPVGLFEVLELPLLLVAVFSTYGRGIFRKRGGIPQMLF